MAPGRGIAVIAVDPAGPAAAHGITAGSRLLEINGFPIRDELDLVFQSADDLLKVIYITPKESRRSVTIKKRFEDSLGIEIKPLKPRACGNRCIFCFVDQNPPGLRKPLYFKDEDFRLSFSHGHYITGTNLKPADLERIISQRLSPLYISVHAADHALRCRMMGTSPARTPEIIPLLKAFCENQIELHTQIVLCPGWNDGQALDATLDQLESLDESLLSVAIVPVGLTIHRKGLPQIEPMTPAKARDVIAQVEPRQKRLLKKRSQRLILLADEFYLLAEAQPPAYTDEEMDYQLENGVGMIATSWKGWPRYKSRLPKISAPPLSAAILTGLLGARVLAPLAIALNSIKGLEVEIIPLKNSLYGRSVTVSGLLPGADFDNALAKLETDIALIPSNALRADGDLFLDGLSLDDLRRNHPHIRIEVVEGGAVEIAEILLSRGRNAK